jgi:CHASE2 domain-containing sensor protein
MEHTMQWITTRIKWVMLLSGLLTCTMVYAAIDPQAALRNTFGATLEGPLADIVVRNWGALITLVGALLIYGADRPASRALVLVIAVVSKLCFISLVLVYGQAYMGKAGVAVVFDLVVVGIFIVYLAQNRRVEGGNGL